MSFQTLQDKNPTSTLKRFMREVAPMQFVREIYMNCLEAKDLRNISYVLNSLSKTYTLILE